MTKEHIVQFAVGIDDDAIIKIVEESAGKQIISDIKIEVLNKIFRAKYYSSKAVGVYRGNIEVDRDADFSTLAEKIICESIADCKEEIIDRAAKLVADSYKRSKAFKEKMAEVNE